MKPVTPSSTSIHLDLKQPSIKLTSSGSGPNLSAALAKHILFSRKTAKVGKMPKAALATLPSVIR